MFQPQPNLHVSAPPLNMSNTIPRVITSSCDMPLIVGYNTRVFKDGGFRMYGIPFDSIDGTRNIQDLLTGFNATETINWAEVLDDDNPTDPTDYLLNAPQVQVQITSGPRESTYSRYYYVSNAYAGDDPKTEEAIYKEGWCDQNGQYVGSDPDADDLGELTPGVSVWIKNPRQTSGYNNTIAGAVNMDYFDIDCPATFRLRASRRPVVCNLNDSTTIAFSGLATGSSINWSEVLDDDNPTDPTDYLGSAPQIQVQIMSGARESTYSRYYYCQNAYAGDDPITEEAIYKAGWCDQNGQYAGSDPDADDLGLIPVGAGFWTKGGTGSFKMIFPAMN